MISTLWACLALDILVNNVGGTIRYEASYITGTVLPVGGGDQG
ncbi:MULTISPECIES: hypothetical protein [unclassified Cupriavidus]|nr:MULTISPECIES: hypothetical protein [unclassified Cupriavidus]